MTFDIHGWIEVTTIPEPDDEWSWCALINFGYLIHGSDDVSERLFGLSKASLGSKALFSGRGLPKHTSLAVRQEWAAYESLGGLEGR